MRFVSVAGLDPKRAAAIEWYEHLQVRKPAVVVEVVLPASRSGLFRQSLSRVVLGGRGPTCRRRWSSRVGTSRRFRSQKVCLLRLGCFGEEWRWDSEGNGGGLQVLEVLD